MARVEIEHFGEIADRKIGIPLFQMGEAAAKQAIDLFRIDPDRAVEFGNGGIVVGLPTVSRRAAQRRKSLLPSVRARLAGRIHMPLA